MKRNILVLTFLSLALLLVACGSKTSSDTTTSNTAASMDPEAELILGTLNLDGTDNTVNAKQAAELLPLWKMYKSLSTSDTAAQEEIDAVMKQIKATMTSQQSEAIDAMDLNSKDMFTLLQDLGLAGQVGTPGPGTTGSTPDFSRMPMFQGTPPAGDGGMLGPGSQDASGGGRQGDIITGDTGGFPGADPGTNSTTPQSGQTSSTFGRNMFNTRLVNALIDYLQKLVNEG